jgi:acetylornithine deacetylase
MINGEPTDMMLTIGQKGVLRVTVEATGKAAHSAYPEEGVSAIVPLLETLRRIRRMPLPFDPTLGSSTLNVGTIQGGVAPNVIPGSAKAEILIRTVANVNQLKAAIMGTIEPGVTITFPLEIPPVQSPTIAGWKSTIVNFASDLPFFASWGVGYQFGPGSIRDAHTSEERIRKADLIAGMERYAALARDLIAGEAK